MVAHADSSLHLARAGCLVLSRMGRADHFYFNDGVGMMRTRNGLTIGAYGASDGVTVAIMRIDTVGGTLPIDLTVFEARQLVDMIRTQVERSTGVRL